MTDATHRFLHTMIRVGDLDRSMAFYCDLLGMTELRRTDVPEARYTNVFIGYGSEKTHPIVELTYNYGTSAYDRGDAFGHLAIGVNDLGGVCDKLRAKGVTIVREPGPVKFGTTEIAFVDDPDGYRVELIDLISGGYADA